MDEQIRKPIFGKWRSPAETGFEPEDVIVVVHDESRLEVHCHGGQIAKRRIIAQLANIGFEQLPWQDLIAPSSTAESAQRLLPQTNTRKTTAVIMWQARGALDRAIADLCNLIETNQSLALRKIGQLLEWADLGIHLVNPWRVAVVGPPNVGKSSLINRILGYQRSIVFDQPGTTRDVLSATTAIDGWPIEFIDTAGLRVAENEIERAGVEQAVNACRRADLVLHLTDVQLDAVDEIENEIETPRPMLHVVNKCDLAVPSANFSDRLKVSAKTGQGIANLLKRVVDQIVPCEPLGEQPVPFTQDQVAALQSAVHSLNTNNPLDAIRRLEELVRNS